MRNMAQITQEVLDNESNRLEEDGRTAQLPNPVKDIERMGFGKKSSYAPSPPDTVGRRLYELKTASKRR